MEGDEGAFQANEEYLNTLVAMGISKDHANEALFCTGNESIESALNYVFSNLVRDTEGDGNVGENLLQGDPIIPPPEIPEEPEVPPEGAPPLENNEENFRSYKMVCVVNNSLKMGVGKVAAQVGHACLGLYREIKGRDEGAEALNDWEYNGEKKIVLKGDNFEKLQELHNKASELNTPCYLVHDAGHTQIPSGSVTVLSIFGAEDEVNEITGDLPLL